MKALLILLLGAVTLTAQTPARVTAATLDDSEVRITYGELKRLVAATLPKEVPSSAKSKAPVGAALLASHYQLDPKSGTITAEMQVESIEDGWQSIPLTGAASSVIAVEPKDARIIVSGDHLCLVTDKAGPQSVKLTFSLSPEGQGTVLHLAASPVAALEVKELAENQVLRLQIGSEVKTLARPGFMALPAAGGEIVLSLVDARKSAPVAASGLTDDAIVSLATYTTQVVRDGSVLTEGTITVRHDHPVKLALQLPEAAKLLQCHVNGDPVRPVVNDAGRVEIPLDDPATDGAESEVKLSFTATLAALQAAEGELDLALPQTPFFAKQIDWNVQLPAAYDLSFAGNVDPIADKATSPGLHLRKSLCRDQQPQARITYRKRTSN
ncbi:MAG: hypothetical protein IAE77_10945 [Prosthecobacter sp.]|jgi:hypothetical protein|uniref:hypothetical protein n=1 Tax=Prosthecobacter sp. TaxID=1965333 RepID=UPI0019FA2F39|nr:hypothetical protein [Prosthecobacter sp.]MBE2283963.1 hypothetical protein [Prosthecobacter sp.]